MCDSFLSHLLKRRIYSTQSAIKKAIQRSPILDTTNLRLFEYIGPEKFGPENRAPLAFWTNVAIFEFTLFGLNCEL